MLTGKISDRRELSPPELQERPPARPDIVQQHIEPAPEDEAASIEVPRGAEHLPASGAEAPTGRRSSGGC